VASSPTLRVDVSRNTLGYVSEVHSAVWLSFVFAWLEEPHLASSVNQDCASLK